MMVISLSITNHPDLIVGYSFTAICENLALVAPVDGNFNKIKRITIGTVNDDILGG